MGGTCLFAMYHAQVTDSQKVVIMDSSSKMDGNYRVLAATVAFGMGIDIPDIRRVIHFGRVGIQKNMCGKVAGEVGMGASVMLYCVPTMGAPAGM